MSLAGVRERKEVRWGILGVGDVCEVKAGPGFYKARGSRLVAVMRRSGAKAEDFARRHSVARWYDSADALLADRDVDAVYIASPVGCHLEHALACARAGKPALLEKPMARCAEEAEKIVAAFEEAGVPLFTAYYRRAHPIWQRVKEELPKIGAVTGLRYELSWERQGDGPQAAGAWRVDPASSGGGLVMDVGSHAVDLIDHLFGAVDVAGACAARGDPRGATYAAGGGVEDRVEVAFRAGAESGLGGVAGSASWDFTRPPGSGKGDVLRVLGTLGSIEASVLGSSAATLLVHGAAPEQLAAPPGPHVHQHLIQQCVDALLDPAARCASTARSGLRANRVLDDALRNYYDGREDGFWARLPSSAPP